MEIIPKLVERLIKTARRIGKVPWCCSDLNEGAAHVYFERRGIFIGSETRAEMIARTHKEAHEHGIDTSKEGWDKLWREIDWGNAE